MGRILTIVPCAPSPVEEHERLVVTNQQSPMFAYVGMVPRYYLNSRQDYTLVCLTLSLRPSIEIGDLVRRAKADIKKFSNNSPMVICVEDVLVAALVAELDRGGEDAKVPYILAGSLEDADVPVSRRRILFSQERSDNPNLFEIVIGKNEVAV